MALGSRVCPLPTGVAGTGRILIGRDGSRSRVRCVYATSPLKLLTPANHGHAAWVYTSTYGGGMVDGDAISLTVDVQAGAAAFLSTQSSTKVYRSTVGATSSVALSVGASGLLVAAPDPTVCFAGAQYRQVQRVDLAGTANIVLIDWLSCGRRAFGERWAFTAYESRLSLRVDGRLVVADGMRLAASDGNLTTRLGRFDVLAMILLAGPNLQRHAASAAAPVSDSPIRRQPDPLVTCARIGESACVIRIAGTSVERVGRTIRQMLNFVPALLGDDPWARKW